MQRLPEHLDMIQSIARHNNAGASTHPCRKPKEVYNAFDSLFPTRTLVPVCKSWISWIRNCGAPVACSAFQRAWRSGGVYWALRRGIEHSVAYIRCMQISRLMLVWTGLGSLARRRYKSNRKRDFLDVGVFLVLIER